MRFILKRSALFVPLIVAGLAVAALLSSMGSVAPRVEAASADDVCFATPDNGTTIYASSTFTAVQVAVDHLGASGGTVLIAGTCTGAQYRSDLGTVQTVWVFSGPVTLRGGYNIDFTVLDPDAHPTVLDAAQSGRVIAAYNILTVENLTLQNGSTVGSGGGLFAAAPLVITNTQVLSNSTENGVGGGVFALESAMIADSHIENNRSNSTNGLGGGIHVGEDNGTLVMINTQVLSNTSNGDGGGVYVVDFVTATNSRIENNRSTNGSGGGLFVRNLVTPIAVAVTNTRIMSNTASKDGGGVFAYGRVTAASSRIENNRSMAGGGGGIYADSPITITTTLLFSNTAAGSGGGVRASGATVANSRIEKNRSTFGSGGGISARSVVLTGTQVLSNTANGGDGGGIYSDGSLAMTNTHILSNTVYLNGGGMYSGGPATVANSRFENNHSAAEFEGGGGGLYARNTLAMTNTHVLSNTALQDGGGVYAFGPVVVANSRIADNHSMFSSGGLFARNTLDMHNTEVLSNTAPFAGGVLVDGSASVTKSRFENNQSGSAGGGIFAFSALSIEDTQLMSNTANSDGGGVYVAEDRGSLTMTRTHVLNNIASQNGGGVFSDGPSTVANSLLVGNTASSGGAIYSGFSLLDLTNSTLAGNHANDTGAALSSNGAVSLTNSILWLNAPNQIAAGGTLDTVRSIVQDGEGGGIDQDPLFLSNPNSATGDLGDLHLSEGSPALDAGDDTVVPNSLNSDLEGLPRLFDILGVANSATNVVDLGAYERNSQTVLTVADAGGPYIGVEGAPVVLDASGSVGVRPLVEYAWDCTNDGSFEATSSSPADSTCLYADNGVFALRLVVRDTLGLTGTLQASVNVVNAAPVVTAEVDQTAAEGSGQSFSLGSFSDAGIDDDPWQVAVDWGDGSLPTAFSQGTQGALPTQTYTYVRSGQYNVTITVTDKDGDAGSNSFVMNVEPAQTNSVQGTVYEDKNMNGEVDSGEGLDNAIVGLTEVAAAAFQNPVTTTLDGEYVFSDVPVGDYRLTVTLPGDTAPVYTQPLTVKAGPVTVVDPIALSTIQAVYLPSIHK